MSLIGFAARICLVRALRGQTMAMDDVQDAPVDPISLAVDAASPSIAVFTDTESTTVDMGRSLLSGDRHMDLMAHVFLPPTLKVTIEGQSVTFAGRRGGAAVVIDLIWRSVERVMMTSDDPWAALWRRFVPRVLQVDHRAYVLEADKAGGGVRIPARQITMRCSTIGEPPFGQEPAGVWADFLAALGTSPQTAPFVPLVRSAIIGPGIAPAWLVHRWYMGETQDEANALGYGPADYDPAFAPDAAGPYTLAPAPQVSVTVDRGGPSDITVGPGYTVTVGSSKGPPT